MIIVLFHFVIYLIPVNSLAESELERILQQEFDGSHSYEYEAEIMDLIGFDRRGRDIHFDSIDYKVTPGHDLSDIYMIIYSLPDDVFQTVF